ncbi:MAG: hypothetical protein JNM72_12180 [Deltaproteobacteria bacterium]|nr:hypothetical protein [Deltaproteobacteria bacterium]
MTGELHRGQAADLVLRSDLGGTEKLLLLGYLSHQNSAEDVERARSWPGIDLLAAYAGVSRRSAITHRNTLIAEGLLEVVARPQGSSLVCRVRLRPLLGRQLARPSTPTPAEALAPDEGGAGPAEACAAALEAGPAVEGCTPCTRATAAPVQPLHGGSAAVALPGVQPLHGGSATIAPEPSSITFLIEPSSENPPHHRPAAGPAGPGLGARGAPWCEEPVQSDVQEPVVEVDENPAGAPSSPTPPPKAAAQRRLRLDELDEGEVLEAAAAPGPAQLPGLPDAAPVPAWARKAGMPKARGSARELAGVVLRSVARVTGRPLAAPWGPGGGAMAGEGRTIDPDAETLPKPVLALLRALRWPELQAFEDQAAAVADAAHRSPDPLFARHLRAIGWTGGADRSRAPQTIFVQEQWEERLDAALAWRDRGCPTALLVPGAPPRGDGPGGGARPPRPAQAASRAFSMDDLDAFFQQAEQTELGPSTPRSAACH